MKVGIHCDKGLGEYGWGSIVVSVSGDQHVFPQVWYIPLLSPLTRLLVQFNGQGGIFGSPFWCINHMEEEKYAVVLDP